MVEKNYLGTMSEREASQCKFDFCKECPFYECEIVEEYIQFWEKHTRIQPQQPQMSAAIIDADSFDFTQNNGRIIQPKAIIPMSDKKDNENTINLTYLHSADADTNSPDTDMCSYDWTRQKDDCFMNCRHVYQIECGRKRVTEGIGDHYKVEVDYNGKIKKGVEDRWEPLQPVFISAQTGQGKNYFIENELIPYVRQLDYENRQGWKVLILSNRKALKRQIEMRLLDSDSSDSEDNINKGPYPMGDFAEAMTYQEMLTQKIVASRYLYVICDEAHFFTSDAMFNPQTKKIFEKIVKVFQNAIRVYMSATPYECLEYIIKYEEEYKDNYLNRNKPQHKWKTGQMVFYHFKRDYSYLDVKTYSAINELYGRIVESVNAKKEKWLIFIDDKDRCATVKEELENFAKDKGSPLVSKGQEVEKVFAVNANSKYDPIYKKIVKDEELGQNIYVLISTSVLDNGVNLEGIKNIVVSDMEKVKCLQMVGRARVKGNDDRKTLYIKRFNVREVKKRLATLEKRQGAYYDYEMAYGKSYPQAGYESKFLSRYHEWEDAKKWFGISAYEGTRFYINEIAKALTDRKIPCYKFISKEMSNENSTEDEQQNEKKHTGQKYLEYQLSWFGKEYCEDDDITFADTEKAKKEFMAFLEPYAESGKHIEDTGKESPFRKKFTDLSKIAFGSWNHNTERCHFITVMNRILKKENINYKIVSHSKYWVVERYNWEMEDSE